jgi:putative addiction module component (TIGR02574 family)
MFAVRIRWEGEMSQAVEQLKSQVGSLSPAERADLLSYLLELSDADGDAAAEWRAEIARRVAAIRSGAAVGRPLEDVLAELREQYP